jgi:hypothetical protein
MEVTDLTLEPHKLVSQNSMSTTASDGDYLSRVLQPWPKINKS